MTYWNIDSEHGQCLAEGIQLEHLARQAAQRTANRLNETVYLYEVGSDESPEGIEPDGSDMPDPPSQR